MDLAAMLALLYAVAFLRTAMSTLDRLVDEDRLTVAHFTAVVRGLPQEKLEVKEVAEHVMTVCPGARVADASAALNWGDAWDLLDKKAAAQLEHERLIAKAAATGDCAGLFSPKKKLAELEKTLTVLSGKLADFNEKELAACGVYLSFETEAQRNTAMAAFPSSAGFSLLHALLGERVHPRAHRFRGRYRLRLSPADEPEDVMRENLQHGWFSRQLRQSVTGLLTFCLLLITVGFMTGAKSFELQQHTQQCGAALNSSLPCDNLWNLTATSRNADCARVAVADLAGRQKASDCNGDLSAAGLWTAGWAGWADASAAGSQCTPIPLLSSAASSPVVQCAALVCQGCFCEAQGISSWLNNQNDIGAYCRSYWQAYVYAWVLKGLTILSIIVVGMVLSKSMPALTRFERLPSRSAMNLSIAIKTLLSTFFNAFVVTLLVDSDIVSLARFPLVFKGPYSDFSPAWYVSVGSALCITCFSQAVQSPVEAVLLGSISRALVSLRSKWVYTQHDLNALLRGDEWQLGTRVAQTLNALWLSIVLCGGMPAVAFLMPLSLGLAYLADRYTLFHVAPKPPPYKAELVQGLRKLVLWSVWLHLAFTAWMFGNPSLPAFQGGESQTRLATLGPADGQFDVGLRLHRWQTLVQAVPFFLLTIYLFIWTPLFGAIGRLLGKRASGHGEAVTLSEARKRSTWEGPTDYDIRNVQRYEDRLAALNPPADEAKEAAPAEEAQPAEEAVDDFDTHRPA